VATIIQAKQCGNHDRTQRWTRLERADLWTRYGELHTQGIAQRQAAKVLDVPRSTLQAWRTYHDRLDACPTVVTCFHSVPCLAFLHRLVIALHVVCVEIGACGIRLVCLMLELTGLNRFVGASYGTQQQVNRRVEEAIVAYRSAESARLAHEMPPKDITMTQDETFTGGLCLVGIEPVSNYIVIEQAAPARDHDTWQALMEPALAELNCRVIQSRTHGTEAAISPNKPLPRTDASSVLAFDPGISAVKSLLTPSRYAGIQASATGSSSFGKLLPIVTAIPSPKLANVHGLL
jgi:hypothetical protein